LWMGTATEKDNKSISTTICMQHIERNMFGSDVKATSHLPIYVLQYSLTSFPVLAHLAFS
jgi:hypothetical protein